jgi:phosphoserine phosphatase RsbU/P
LWRFDGRGLRPFTGSDPGWTPPLPRVPGPVPTPEGSIWLAPVPEAEGFWLEVSGVPHERAGELSLRLASVLGVLFTSERETGELTNELAERYEEIDLLYAISEILGHTLRLEEAAQTIIREVSDVVGARRASIMVYDEEARHLVTVAARGFSAGGTPPVPPDDPYSIAARVFREQRVISGDLESATPPPPIDREPRDYKSESFLSIPICYAAPGLPARCVGVINLTNRLGGDAFSPSDRKLVAAIANQIGAAIENARLVQRDLRQQRVQRELELAHDLQLKLLPSPSVLQGDAAVAAICRPVDSVGGDFYSFSRLGGGRVGVMFGDVSSHGFSAALVMALVVSAVNIHAGAGTTPDETLGALLESLGPDLATTEMFLSVFYGVLDPKNRRLTYANAGHQHAFKVPGTGPPERLVTTAPPLGLASAETIKRHQIPWTPGGDLLCLWTDGLIDARNGNSGFTEERLLEEIMSRRSQTPDEIVRAAFRLADDSTAKPADDRTLLVLRI